MDIGPDEHKNHGLHILFCNPQFGGKLGSIFLITPVYTLEKRLAMLPVWGLT